MDMHIKDIPIDIRRRAAQHLASLRDTGLAPGTEDLALADTAVPIHRPDREGIAYYEFHLVRGGAARKPLLTASFASLAAAAKKSRRAGEDASTTAAAGQTVGFIIASADRHDFPIAHWSLDRLPPSLQVLQQDDGGCGCGKDGTREAAAAAARIYKLDALAYVAEDDGGRLVGGSGQHPALLKGLPHALEKFAGRISSSTARPVGQAADDLTAAPGEHAYERKDGDVPEVAIETGDVDWDSYKKHYADAFGPLLDALRARAGRTWELDDAIAKYGEGIFTGSRHRVALLGEASIDLQGEGARLVRASIDDGDGGQPTLLIDALPAAVAQETELGVSIKYASGEYERLQFFIVSRDTPTNARDGNPGCHCED